MQSTMHLYPINGADWPGQERCHTWGYRDATWSSAIVGVDPDPANKKKIPKWAKEYWNALHPYFARGSGVVVRRGFPRATFPGYELL